ncbi:MAG: putative toxin-antitoxin system toxin component, PIN family [Oxalobacteraceae bacterium]
MIPKASASFRPRVVLDTNVCLDLFMFRDLRWQALLAPLVRGEVEAFTRHDCRREFELVLAYDKWKLSTQAQSEILMEFDQHIRRYAGGDDAAAGDTASGLPVCKDSDDQKFLEVALACRADVLITKDKALLKLARKTARLGQFTILPPESWQGWFEEALATQPAQGPAESPP